MEDKNLNDIYYKLDEILRELKKINENDDSIVIDGEELAKHMERGTREFTTKIR